MSENVKVDVTVEEREPTPEELELMAAKQLLIELHMIKRRIQESGTLLNGMLIMQVRFLLNGLMSKYNTAGLLVGETVELKLTGRKATDSIYFKHSPKLQKLIDEVIASELKKQEEAKETE